MALVSGGLASGLGAVPFCLGMGPSALRLGRASGTIGFSLLACCLFGHWFCFGVWGGFALSALSAFLVSAFARRVPVFADGGYRLSWLSSSILFGDSPRSTSII